MISEITKRTARSGLELEDIGTYEVGDPKEKIRIYEVLGIK